MMTLWLPRPLWAHGVNTSYATVVVRPGWLELRVQFELADAIAHFSLDADQDRTVAPHELARAGSVMAAFTQAHVRLELDGTPVVLTYETSALGRDASGRDWIELKFHRALDTDPASLTATLSTVAFELLGQDHTTLLAVTAHGQTWQAVLSLGEPWFRVALPQPVRTGNR